MTSSASVNSDSQSSSTNWMSSESSEPEVRLLIPARTEGMDEEHLAMAINRIERLDVHNFQHDQHRQAVQREARQTAEELRPFPPTPPFYAYLENENSRPSDVNAIHLHRALQRRFELEREGQPREVLGDLPEYWDRLANNMFDDAVPQGVGKPKDFAPIPTSITQGSSGMDSSSSRLGLRDQVPAISSNPCIRVIRYNSDMSEEEERGELEEEGELSDEAEEQSKKEAEEVSEAEEVLEMLEGQMNQLVECFSNLPFHVYVSPFVNEIV